MNIYTAFLPDEESSNDEDMTVAFFVGEDPPPMPCPALSLVGGHTYLDMPSSKDDYAGDVSCISLDVDSNFEAHWHELAEAAEYWSKIPTMPDWLRKLIDGCNNVHEVYSWVDEIAGRPVLEEA